VSSIAASSETAPPDDHVSNNTDDNIFADYGVLTASLSMLKVLPHGRIAQEKLEDWGALF
jgi:hypothetical protein